MISRSEIEQNLRRLDRRYRRERQPKELLYISKLAVLELCGWIEMSMDDVVERCLIRKLREASNRKTGKTFVKRNYGFEYERHFRGMLISTIGIIGVEKIEAQLDPVNHAKLTAHLKALHNVRNSLAHTYVRGVTTTIEAPSQTIARFNEIYIGLKEYDVCIRQTF